MSTQKPRGRKLSKARAIACPAGDAPENEPCAYRQRSKGPPQSWYCAPRLRAVHLEPAKGGPAKSGHQRRHPERKTRRKLPKDDQ